MAEHLSVLREMAAAAGLVGALGDAPLTIVSAADQPPAVIATHRALAQLSSDGRHIVSAKSGHWIHLDEPELVVRVVRETVERARLRRIRSAEVGSLA